MPDSFNHIQQGCDVKSSDENVLVQISNAIITLHGIMKEPSVYSKPKTAKSTSRLRVTPLNFLTVMVYDHDPE
jgi:hypothetical protein